ncbi:MAG TPA: hypothetical protein VFY08_01755 [Actinomycetota bacterium]|nr:hypothetical protein [Actinomycetota bacterium]
MLGQVSVDPTVTPVLNNGGWVFNAAELLALLGIVLTVAIVFGYMRLAPRFQTDEQTRRSVRVPRMQPDGEVRRPVKVIGTPIIVQPPVIAPAVAGGPAAAAAPAPAPAPPAPGAAPVAPAAAPAAPAAAPAGPAAPAAPAVTPAGPAAPAAPAVTPAAAPAAAHADVSLDQETFDRVLAELLEKGTDRRVAEGQARRAAMIAARKKAEG